MVKCVNVCMKFINIGHRVKLVIVEKMLSRQDIQLLMLTPDVINLRKPSLIRVS